MSGLNISYVCNAFIFDEVHLPAKAEPYPGNIKLG